MDQIKKFYITSFLKNQSYFTPILILFFQLHSLSYTQVFWVFTIGSILSLTLEIPTGIFADIFGKRNSIIWAKITIFFSFISFGMSHDFISFIFSQCLFELGQALRSGTESAYVYDYLIENKEKVNTGYTEVKGKQKFWARISESAAAMIGGFLAAWLGYSAVFFIAAIPALINILISISWEKIDENIEKKDMKSIIAHTKESIYELRKKPKLFRIILNISLFAGVIAAIGTFIQPYMDSLGIPLTYFGIIYGFSLALSAFAVRYSFIFERRLGMIKAVNIFSALAVIPLLILGLGHFSIFGVLLFFSLTIIENIRSPIANNEFHTLVPSKKRATLGSILALSKSLVKMMILPIAGYFADAFSIYTSILMMGSILTLNAIFFHIKEREKKETS